MMEIVKVGMADYKVLKTSGILTTLGLGSCVGIALYDKYSKVAGLAHIMLPSSLEIKNNSNKAKFADTAIVELIKEMKLIGANENKLVAKLAGGSQMFSFNSNTDILRIGERNVLASKKVLQELSIPILSEDTGGNYGRTIELSVTDGNLLVKTVGHGTKNI
ncbi:chemotaxis protein CheD [Proteiniborus ethanoligenes]|uniref:Probable chemoreceptor glutamine deamidase CheD n=1 Tax=Proteiniborus ethanoligenes TaxID=415015 RepID=A0A1H3N536_9FIRM|nr:chemotaxis protein CheD [Proteiniborus ethanoligenes]TAH63177.1 MAG: chemotaxis protein CheD [Gottschalkiaceae bacterium]SDY83956.1 chemotaxis protein CheD [Proteiniborus ethanoligenes]